MALPCPNVTQPSNLPQRAVNLSKLLAIKEMDLALLRNHDVVNS
jgi:hypothetical protein